MKKKLLVLMLAVFVLVVSSLTVSAITCTQAMPTVEKCGAFQNEAEWETCKGKVSQQCTAEGGTPNNQQACCVREMPKCVEEVIQNGIGAIAGEWLSTHAQCTEAQECVKSSTNLVQLAPSLFQAVPNQNCLSSQWASTLAEATEKTSVLDLIKPGNFDQMMKLLEIGASYGGLAIQYLTLQETAKNNAFQREDTLYQRAKAEEREREEDSDCDPQTGIGRNCESLPPPTASSENIVSLASQTNFCTGNICQDTSQVPQGTEFLFSSIHMTFPNDDYIGLLEGPNSGISYEDGIFRFDSSGTTLFSVKEYLMIIEQEDGRRLGLGKGSTYYFGSTQDYVTNTRIIDGKSATVVTTTFYRDGNEFQDSNDITGAITGRATFENRGPTTGVSYDHFNLPGNKNAVDIGDLGDRQQIQGRGYFNMELLSRSGQFPVTFRGVAKGDTLILFNKDVKLDSTFLVQDPIYEYAVVPEDSSTKVYTENNKVIQDSAGLPQELSSRQRNLIYNS